MNFSAKDPVKDMKTSHKLGKKFENYISDKSLDPKYIKNYLNSTGKKSNLKINTGKNTPPNRTYVSISTCKISQH